MRELFEKSSLKPSKTFTHFATDLQNIKSFESVWETFCKISQICSFLAHIVFLFEFLLLELPACYWSYDEIHRS